MFQLSMALQHNQLDKERECVLVLGPVGGHLIEPAAAQDPLRAHQIPWEDLQCLAHCHPPAGVARHALPNSAHQPASFTHMPVLDLPKYSGPREDCNVHSLYQTARQPFCPDSGAHTVFLICLLSWSEYMPLLLQKGSACLQSIYATFLLFALVANKCAACGRRRGVSTRWRSCMEC